MAKPPIDPDGLMKAIFDAMKSAGISATESQLKTAIGGATKSAGRRAPKITPKTAAGGAGRKPPKPPKAGAAAPAPKPKGPKKPSGGAKKMTKLQKREINVARHAEERSKWLSETAEKSRIAKEETRAANRAAWAKRQEEMEAKRLAGRAKMNKKKGAK